MGGSSGGGGKPMQSRPELRAGQALPLRSGIAQQPAGAPVHAGDAKAELLRLVEPVVLNLHGNHDLLGAVEARRRRLQRASRAHSFH